MDTTVSLSYAYWIDLPMVVQYCQTFAGSFRPFLNVYRKYVFGTSILFIFFTRESPNYDRAAFEIG